MGNVLVYKQRFSNLIRAFLAAQKMRQGTLAVAMGITDSAVSQIISGKITPSVSQIETMVRMLRIGREKEMELKVLVARIRAGGELLRSKLGIYIMEKRMAAGLSYAKLGQMTGIPVGQLRLFENSLEVSPTPEEMRSLAEHLGFPLGEALLLVEADGILEENLEACEAATSYGGGNFMPVLNMDVLSSYRFNQPVSAFAARHAVGRMPRPEGFPAGTSVLPCRGRDLGLAWKGAVQLFLFDEFGSNAKKLVLGRDAAEKFRLCECRKNGCVEFQISEPNAGPVDLGAYIPVLAVMLLTTDAE